MDQEKISIMQLTGEKHAQIIVDQSSSDIFRYREHNKALESDAVSGTLSTSRWPCLVIIEAIAGRIQE